MNYDKNSKALTNSFNTWKNTAYVGSMNSINSSSSSYTSYTKSLSNSCNSLKNSMWSLASSLSSILSSGNTWSAAVSSITNSVTHFSQFCLSRSAFVGNNLHVASGVNGTNGWYSDYVNNVAYKQMSTYAYPVGLSQLDLMYPATVDPYFVSGNYTHGDIWFISSITFTKLFIRHDSMFYWFSMYNATNPYSDIASIIVSDNIPRTGTYWSTMNMSISPYVAQHIYFNRPYANIHRIISISVPYTNLLSKMNYVLDYSLYTALIKSQQNYIIPNYIACGFYALTTVMPQTMLSTLFTQGTFNISQGFYLSSLKTFDYAFANYKWPEAKVKDCDFYYFNLEFSGSNTNKTVNLYHYHSANTFTNDGLEMFLYRSDSRDAYPKYNYSIITPSYSNNGHRMNIGLVYQTVNTLLLYIGKIIGDTVFEMRNVVISSLSIYGTDDTSKWAGKIKFSTYMYGTSQVQNSACYKIDAIPTQYTQY
jgi:hypothetical protein